MCFLSLTESLSLQLANMGGNVKTVEDNMSKKAWSANIHQPGLLDSPDTNLKSGFADDLRRAGVRKARVNRHRVYFVGQHIDCNYTAFFIKLNKQGDNKAQDDNSTGFQAIIRNALTSKQVTRVLADPNDQLVESSQSESVTRHAKDWKDATWYKEFGDES